MNTVWGTRYRLLQEQLDQLVDWLGAQQPLGPQELEEQTVRLLLGVIRLLRQHEVNRRGQCRFCGWTRWGWRIWHRRPRCTVYRALDFAMTQPMDVVWWQLFQDTGRDIPLDEAREWIAQRDQATHRSNVTNNYTNDDIGDDDTVELKLV